MGEFLRDNKVPTEIANEFENRLEEDWKEQEKTLLAVVGNIARDFKSAITKNVDMAPSCDTFRISEIHRGQVAQLSKLTDWVQTPLHKKHLTHILIFLLLSIGSAIS